MHLFEVANRKSMDFLKYLQTSVGLKLFVNRTFLKSKSHFFVAVFVVCSRKVVVFFFDQLVNSTNEYIAKRHFLVKEKNGEI